MGNPYFKFKQFEVWQDECAMKVTTDACVFGAVVAAEPAVQMAKKVLDVGAGTGLLTLMVAQQNSQGCLDAVEIEPAAARQAAANFANSPWASRLSLETGSVMDLPAGQRYDVVISNPPFFENGLRSTDKQRSTALHNTQFLLDWFPSILERCMLPEGRFYVLLPAAAEAGFLATMQAANWYPCFGLRLCQTENHSPFRCILGFKQGPQAYYAPPMVAVKTNNRYSNELLPLLTPYYLYL